MDLSCNRQKILLVDDMPANLMMLGEELKKDYDIFIATSGEAALNMAEDNPPDLILLDVVMPNMDGREVCRRLKDNEVTKNIPVIFITANNAEGDEEEGLSIGAVDYITKPFSLPILRARVRTHLDLKRKTDILENLSSRDGLTGIYNRRQFDKEMFTEWKRAVRNGQQLSLLMIDLDCFKLYNDNYGHIAGDRCLQMVARAFSSSLKRATDFVARYGGEEFAVVLPDTDMEHAIMAAEEIRSVIRDLKIEHAYSKAGPFVSVSIGAATARPMFEIEPSQLIDAADKALYEAKGAGRNTIRQRSL
jgi:diguanylate cyclase (GGDEF)-like protein